MKPFGTEAFNGIRLALEEDEALGSAGAVGLVVKDSALPTAQLRRDVSQLLDEFAPIAPDWSFVGPGGSTAGRHPGLRVRTLYYTHRDPAQRQAIRTVLVQQRHDAVPPDQPAGGLCHAAFRVYAFLYPGPADAPWEKVASHFSTGPRFETEGK